MNSRQARVARPVDIARQLANGALGGTYTDGVLLLSALVSGLAAEAWPDGPDRARFVELLVRNTPPESGASRVSLPLLVRHLRVSGHHPVAATIEQSRPGMFGPGHDSRVLTGDDVDTDDEDFLLSAGVDRRTVRLHSYASVLYKHVRCSVVHEYQLGRSATAWPMTSKVTDISYSNLLIKSLARPGTPDDEPELRPRSVLRQIHFRIDWLASLALMAAAARGDGGELPPPTAWWLDGNDVG